MAAPRSSAEMAVELEAGVGCGEETGVAAVDADRLAYSEGCASEVRRAIVSAASAVTPMTARSGAHSSSVSPCSGFRGEAAQVQWRYGAVMSVIWHLLGPPRIDLSSQIGRNVASQVRVLALLHVREGGRYRSGLAPPLARERHAAAKAKAHG